MPRFTFAKNTLAVVVGCVLLGSCQFVPGTEAYYRHESRLALYDHVLDIDTAKITKVSAVDDPKDGKVICGNVNGRNEFGAYAGQTPFAVRMRDKLVALADPAVKPTDDTTRLIGICNTAKAWG